MDGIGFRRRREPTRADGDPLAVCPGHCIHPLRGADGNRPLQLVRSFGLYAVSQEAIMQMTVSDAKARLSDLVRRVEAGEEVVLTRHGYPVAQLVAAHRRAGAKDRRDIIASVRARAAAKIAAGPGAARSQDFLYDDEGLPR
jgi:prevent-host-death family protein